MEKTGQGCNSNTKWQLIRPQLLLTSIRRVFCCVSVSGRISSVRAELVLHSPLDKSFFERARTPAPDKLDLSLCTVGTSSAFLQTADNICLLTCTVTCRTFLTLQMILPADPPSSGLSHPDSGAQTRAVASGCQQAMQVEATFHIMPLRLTR